MLDHTPISTTLSRGERQCNKGRFLLAGSSKHDSARTLVFLVINVRQVIPEAAGTG